MVPHCLTGLCLEEGTQRADEDCSFFLFENPSYQADTLFTDCSCSIRERGQDRLLAVDHVKVSVFITSTVTA